MDRLSHLIVDNWRLLACTGGLMLSFLTYGILQEKIMDTPYPPDQAMFTFSAFLVLINRFFAVGASSGVLIYNKESLAPVAPVYAYVGVSLSNVFATFCQYEALKFVSFPTQTLGKCGKMIPVMVWGTLYYGKRYPLKEYLITSVVTLGCLLFLLTGEIKAGKATDQSDTPWGLLLMFGYLFADGFTTTLQEKLFTGFKMSTYNQMLYVNISSAVVSVMILLGSGQLFPAITFASTHPALVWDALGLSMCTTVGQQVIYYTIKEFGALIFSTIMTTRQFLSILLSCIIYLHPLTFWQWVGTVMVFGAIYYKSAGSSHGHGHGPKPTPPPEKVSVVVEDKAAEPDPESK